VVSLTPKRGKKQEFFIELWVIRGNNACLSKHLEVFIALFGLFGSKKAEKTVTKPYFSEKTKGRGLLLYNAIPTLVSVKR